MQKIKIDSEKCLQDHPCPLVRICPVGAIEQDGFSVPKIDHGKCISCGRCVASCFYGAFSVE